MFPETEPGTLGRVLTSPPPKAWAGPSPGPPRLVPSFQTHLSMQIFSTWGTSTCSRRMMVWRGSFDFQDRICESHTQS